MSLAHGGVVPHIIIRSSRLRLGEFEAPAAKRLLQHYRREAVSLVSVNPSGSQNRHVLNADDVREYLVGRLAKFKIPRQIQFLERLPRTPLGKVQKYLLRQSRVGGDTIPPNGA